MSNASNLKMIKLQTVYEETLFVVKTDLLYNFSVWNVGA